MGAIQNSINQAFGVGAALNAPTKALEEQEKRQAAVKKAEIDAAIKKEEANIGITTAVMEEANGSFSQLKKPIQYLNMPEVQAYKSNLEGGKTAYNAAINQMSKSYQALYELSGDPEYAKKYADAMASYGRNSSLFKTMQETLNRRETDLLKAQEANKRAQEILQAKKQIREQTMKRRQSYLDQPLSIGGKEIGTVRGLPKDMRSQVKEGIKNGR